MRKTKTITLKLIERHIYSFRGQRVMIDAHLAMLYGVQTKRLNEAVRRNKKRFPTDFMFRLTKPEAYSLRSQIATSNIGRGGRRYLPLAFTEQGVAMLSSVLNSGRAIEVNIAIMRTFVRLREILSSHKDLVARLMELEVKYQTHDSQIRSIFEAIRQLVLATEKRQNPIGFRG